MLIDFCHWSEDDEGEKMSTGYHPIDSRLEEL